MFLIGPHVPDVGECFEPGRHRRGDERITAEWADPHKGTLRFCAQCDGKHDHEWVPCKPTIHHPSVQVAVRCRTCGGRKCDVPECIERRHHVGPHQYLDGTFEPCGNSRL